ncbi:hypothetical protein Dimus_002080 [Dionaea muscipula]
MEAQSLQPKMERPAYVKTSQKDCKLGEQNVLLVQHRQFPIYEKNISDAIKQPLQNLHGSQSDVFNMQLM